MALVKWRVYVESTVLSDWLLVETTPVKRRDKLSDDVLDSHDFVGMLLKKPPSNLHVYTSYWSLFESVGAVKRANIEVWMVLDGVLTAFYHEVKDLKKYQLRKSQLDKTRRLIHHLVEGMKEQKALELVSEASDIDAVVSLIHERNLEAPDSFHVGIALSHGCDIFLTRDAHYDKVKTFFDREKIEVMTPTELLNRLRFEWAINP